MDISKSISLQKVPVDTSQGVAFFCCGLVWCHPQHCSDKSLSASSLNVENSSLCIHLGDKFWIPSYWVSAAADIISQLKWIDKSRFNKQNKATPGWPLGRQERYHTANMATRSCIACGMVLSSPREGLTFGRLSGVGVRVWGEVGLPNNHPRLFGYMPGAQVEFPLEHLGFYVPWIGGMKTDLLIEVKGPSIQM